MSGWLWKVGTGTGRRPMGVAARKVWSIRITNVHKTDSRQHPPRNLVGMFIDY